MFAKIALLFALVAAASAAPGLPFVAPAPVALAAPFVTSHSSQVVARNHNALVAPVVAAAYSAPIVAPAVAAPVVPSAPFAAYSSPLPAAFPAPFASPYAAPFPAPYSAPFGYPSFAAPAYAL